MQRKIIIEAKDCLPIQCNEVESAALFHFVSTISAKTFHFSPNQKKEESIVYFDYQKRQWIANRYIGECEFIFNNQVFMLKITPRFGHELLLKMFEYIYSTKLPPSYHTLAKSKSMDIHKLLISIIWIAHLKKALKHGLYKVNKQIKEEGTTIRGKFLIKESLIDSRTNNILHYFYTRKEIENTPNRILFKAFLVLKRNYFLSESFLSNTIKMDLNKLNNVFESNFKIKFSEYKNIKYSNLYVGYKPLIDLSWEIISNKELGVEESKKEGNSFFLDMAEVWELFIHRTLVKSLIPLGWNLINKELIIYESTFYKRKLMPDIVLEKEDKVLVLDAKYKRMNYSNLDIDRNDLFQIHTYSYFFTNQHKAIYSGLIYPLQNRIELKLENILYLIR